jgi:hypothetical protein
MTQMHATLQFPAAIVIIMVAILMFMRASRHSPGSTAIRYLLAGFVLANGVKQAYWQLRWMLAANDYPLAADFLASVPTIPILCNATIIILGSAVIARAFAAELNKRLIAYSVVAMATLALVGIGYGLAGGYA